MLAALKRSEHEIYESDDSFGGVCPVDRLAFERLWQLKQCRRNFPRSTTPPCLVSSRSGSPESAAPAEVSSHATIYILGPKGYEKAREGTNGFSCFVGRQFLTPPQKRRLRRSASTPKAAALSCLSTCRVNSCAQTASRRPRSRQTSPADIRKAATRIPRNRDSST